MQCDRNINLTTSCGYVRKKLSVEENLAPSNIQPSKQENVPAEFEAEPIKISIISLLN
jgi:hypothetical protein